MRKITAAILFSALGASCTALAAPPAPTQLPTGGQVVSGSANLSQTGTQLSITQSTGKAIVNWQTFSIGSGAQVVFVQPSSSSATLNRVLSAEPSSIYGQLSANGNVFLINPNGILVGASGQINTNGLTLSTSNISDAEFLAGSNHFSPIGGGLIRIDGNVSAGSGGISILAPLITISGYLVSTGPIDINSPSTISIGAISLPTLVPSPPTLMLGDATPSSASSTPNGQIAIGSGATLTLSMNPASSPSLNLASSNQNSGTNRIAMPVGGATVTSGGIAMPQHAKFDSLIDGAVTIRLDLVSAVSASR